jgi:hypothetical protein
MNRIGTVEPMPIRFAAKDVSETRIIVASEMGVAQREHVERSCRGRTTHATLRRMVSKKRRSRPSRKSRSSRGRAGNSYSRSRSKSDIESAGLSGLPVAFAAVARVSRNGRVVTLRHVWSDGVDARIWSAVRNAFGRGAQDIANRIGKPVEVYSMHGNVIAAFEPSR